MKNKKIVIAFIIDFLASSEGLAGGTERQLIELVNYIDKSKDSCQLEFKGLEYHPRHYSGIYAALFDSLGYELDISYINPKDNHYIYTLKWKKQ